jgi:solute carrier family 10 (sodium/bile acid cotransporter), member 7
MPSPVDSTQPARQRGGNWFLYGLLGAVVLATLTPGFGARGGPLQPELISKLGVALIFASQGLLLSLSALRDGTLSWRTHVVVQGTTFVFFPLLGLLLLLLDVALLPVDLRLGVFYLCALPSTLSSAVALTAAAKGNTPVAALNATVSNVLGIAITPLWVGIAMPASGQALELGDRIVDLLLWLGVPFLLGHWLRPWFGAWAGRRKSQLLAIDQAIVLVLVYTSFCDSIRARLWNTSSVSLLVGAALAAAALLVLSMAFIHWVTKALAFAAPERIAALFCGSHKTLATGVPMAALLFGSRPQAATWLLPLMIYHPLQLVVGAWLANRFGRRETVLRTESS